LRAWGERVAVAVSVDVKDYVDESVTFS